MPQGLSLMLESVPFPWGQTLLKVSLSQQEQLRALEQDNCRLSALVCKVRSLGHWRLAVQRARFQGQLNRAEKVSVRRGRPTHPAQQGVTDEVGGWLTWGAGLALVLARPTILTDLTVDSRGVFQGSD